jgi:ubiquinone/menaquinone biosynthesis C-methylase UbiE
MTDPIADPVRESYDRLAAEYARRMFHELDRKPLDRELLTRFASEVSGRGQVCDMGCGPGHVARYLHQAGAAVFGLDLSASMVDEARRLTPEVPFHQGNMLALDLSGASLAGIAAFYSIVNIPAASPSTVFHEMARVLQPRGLLLLAFHVGNEALHPVELWGRPISMDFYLFEPPLIRQHLESAGLEVEEVIEREQYAPEVEHQSRRAYIFARKPAPAH